MSPGDTRSGPAAPTLPRALVAEDDRDMRELIGIVLRGLPRAPEVVMVENAVAAMDLLEEEPTALLVTDLCMPGADGLDLLRFARRCQPLCQVLLVTGFATVDSAVAALKDGAFDYLQKPFDTEQLRARAQAALEYHGALAESARLRQPAAAGDDESMLVGRSRGMEQVERLVEAAAAYESGVLVTGESGSGKELVVRRIHRLGSRRDKPFVAINCAAIPDTLIESELFGYRRGAFTGADRSKAGLFEAADGGTLFLDEINNAPMALQAKLLRVLQDGQFYPAGATEAVCVDVRVIAATNVPLPTLVDKGEFRRDLYYRLSVMEIDLPPLRERPDDIALLAMHFLERHARRLGKPVTGMTPAVLGALVRYDWPGNVRELENLVQRMIILCAEDRLDVDVLPAHLAQPRAGEARPIDYLPPQSLEEMEAYIIRKTLRKTRGDRTLTAEILGIDKSTLWRKVKRYNIKD
ncbi:MAG: sigma-54-dependent Fis family transcriptional regulator [Rubrivivax sp.]|nr:sigma-54-dependent Fis family transcriptional regulator [Rubrivivax sp.]